MNDLIRELKKEHKAILDVLAEVRAVGISSRAGREKLLAARDLLLAHMRHEDEQYYPGLREAAEGSRELKLLMDYFVDDMAAVSGKALRLFEKYGQGGHASEFAGDITILYMLLRDRIQTEEEKLFEKFSGRA